MGIPHDMQTASAEQLRQVFEAANILLVDHEPLVANAIAAVLQRYGASAIDRATTADEALDALGYTSRPYNLVMLRAGLPHQDAVKVLRVLTRQKAQLRVTLHGADDLTELREPQWYEGIARCIEISGLPGIVRGSAIVLASDATIANIIASNRVPETMSADCADAIYGAPPGTHAKRQLNR